MDNKEKRDIKPIYDSRKFKQNPFETKLEIVVTETNRKNEYRINEFGEYEPLIRQYEQMRFSKVYEHPELRKMTSKLSLRALQLWVWIMYSIEAGEDQIWIPKNRYMREHEIKTIDTYREAVKDLINNNFIIPYSIKNVFRINPNIFFKGDRIKKYPKCVKIIDRKNKIVNKDEGLLVTDY